MDILASLYAQQPDWAQTLIALAGLVLAALAVNFILKRIILRAAAPYLDQTTNTSDKSAAWLATAAPLLVISFGIALVPSLPEQAYTIIRNLAQALIVISVAMAIVTALTYVNELYERQPRSNDRPIKGFIQLIKIVVLCGAAIILISVLIDQSPLLLLSPPPFFLRTGGRTGGQAHHWQNRSLPWIKNS